MNRLSPNYFHAFRFWTFSLGRQELPVSSPCPSVRIYRRGSHWKDFREIYYWRLYENMSRHCRFGYILTKMLVCLHEDLSVFHIFGSHMCRATIQLTNCCVSMATLSVCFTWTIQRQRIVAFPSQWCLRERAILLRYTYIVCLAKILFESFY